LPAVCACRCADYNNQINKTAAACSAIFFVIIYLPFFAGKSLMNLCAGRSSFRSFSAVACGPQIVFIIIVLVV